MTMMLTRDQDQAREREHVPGLLLEVPEFATAMQEMINRDAPRLFAVVREFVDSHDVEIVAWGMATEKSGMQVHAVRGGMILCLRSPEMVLKCFDGDGHAVARIMWVGDAVER
ncbi:hypothetical protein [Saccharothrix xinjiangensis]|uniref:Uncharacterized protein n=1 Tax=Saccharothrix xinjiangensis TaxID=204798 RepID=A0ABV9XWG6_9PSEU